MRTAFLRAPMVVSAFVLVLSACGHHSDGRAVARPRSHPRTTRATKRADTVADNVYAHTGVGQLSPAVAGVPGRVYVPNSEADTVDVIDPATFRIVDHFAVGRLPQHVTPAWDLRTLYVDNDLGNSLTPIDPRTGAGGRRSRSPTPTTSTSRRTGPRRSSSPRSSGGWTFATPTRGRC